VSTIDFLGAPKFTTSFTDYEPDDVSEWTMSETSERLVYVVTTGRWSDYGIEAIFSLETSATAYADMVSRVNTSAYRPEPYARVEAWPMDKHLSAAERGLIAFTVQFDDDGRAHAYGRAGEETEEAIGSNFAVFGTPLTCHTMQHDEATAIKVCAERRAEYLAAREGVLA
jgi:hypothetical protein